jgi:ferredoxin
MIFYFTGTGNSYYAAQKIGEYMNERVISIADEMKKNGELEYSLKEDELIGFVYPVYAWAPPRIVLDFIKRIRLNNYNGSYLFSIAICGDNIGKTMELLKSALKKKGMELNSGFSIGMPNNYIISYNLDSKELEMEKLSKADEKLKEISNILKERKKDVFDVVKGTAPGILTYLFSPLFNMFMPNTKKFFATDDCTGCGLCQKICSTGNITLDKKPVWGSNCTLCLACLHRCPAKAIQYGKSTMGKGRYVHPIYRK